MKRVTILLLLVGFSFGTDCEGNSPDGAGGPVGFGAPSDLDGGGIPGGDADCPDPTNAEQIDTDSDGVIDACDDDDDADGLSDADEFLLFSDPLNPDTDGDGLLDGDEFHTYGTDPILADSDSDLLSDGDEVLVYGTMPLFFDSDVDGLMDGIEVDPAFGSNPLDPDTDADGILDGPEIDLLLDLLIPNPIGTVFEVYCSDYIEVVGFPLQDGLYENSSFTDSFILWSRFDVVALSSLGGRLVNLDLGAGVIVDRVGFPQWTDSIFDTALDGSWLDLTATGLWFVSLLDQIEVSDWILLDTVLYVQAPGSVEYFFNPRTCELVQVSR